MSLSVDTILQSLAGVADPCLEGVDLLSRKVIKNIEINGGDVSFDLLLGYPAAGIQQSLLENIEAQVKAVAGVESVSINLQWNITAHKTQKDIATVPNIKNIIAVASGKGGVGKSTTSVNLALALQKEGAKVGLLDADIYGPSQPMMLGIDESEKPKFIDEKHFYPIEAYDLQTMSIGYMVTEKTPMIWRGPMVSGALQQLLNQCRWRELDYLIIDLPPGTGDIQLTLAQKIPVTGVVIVTTPQDVATLDAKKAIEMFRKVEIPVLGVIENMAVHVCSNCGHPEHLFGQGGGQRIAEDYQSELLGALPLDISIRAQTDNGKPSVVADPESDIAQNYREIARRVAARLAVCDRAQAAEMIASDH